MPRTVSLRLEEKRVGAVVPTASLMRLFGKDLLDIALRRPSAPKDDWKVAIHAEDVRILRKTFARVQAHTKPATPSSTSCNKGRRYASRSAYAGLVPLTDMIRRPMVASKANSNRSGSAPSTHSSL